MADVTSLPVSAISPTEVKNNDAVVFIGKPKYDATLCEFVPADIGDMHMIPYASKVETDNKQVIDKTDVLNSLDKKSLVTLNDRELKITTKRITGSEAYKNIFKPIIDHGWVHPDNLVQITVLTQYEYACATPTDKDAVVRTATGKMWAQSYIAPFIYDKGWYSGDLSKIVEQVFTFPTYTQMIPVELSGAVYKKFAQSVIDGKYPYGDRSVYNPNLTGMAKFVTTK